MADINILGVLPVRGGSKGIPGKNIRDLCGQPLLAWAGRALLESSGIDRSICSTDDDKIADIARSIGLDVPYKRPSELSNDTAKMHDVLLHAVDIVDDDNRPYTHIALVQATTPTVTKNDIEKAISYIQNNGADTVISGFKVGMHHPALMYTLTNNKVEWLLDSNLHEQQRQKFPEIFVRTGLIYIISINILRERKSIYGDRIFSLLIDESRAVTIDEENDFLLAERIMKGVSL